MSDLHIPTPCHESWDGMTPTADGRHCAACNHVVVDVTSLPVVEGRQILTQVAQGLVTSPGKRTCVRAHANPSGRLVPGRRKLLTPALVVMLASAMTGCIGDGPELGKPQTPRTETTAVVQPTNHPSALQGTPVPRPVPQPIEALQGDVCLSPKLGTVAPPIAPVRGEPEAIKGKVVAPTHK